MSLPFPFVAGLLLLVVQTLVDPRLPEDPPLARLYLAAPLLLAPGLAVWRLLARGRPPTPKLVHVGSLAVPLCYSCYALITNLPELAPRLAADSFVRELAVLLGPLLVAELALRSGEQAAISARGFPRASLAYLPQVGFARLPMVAFLAAPFFACALAADVVLQRRPLAAFFQQTALGATVGAILLLVGLSVLMPLLARMCLPITRLGADEPARAAGAAAEELGFPRQALCVLDTGHREVNAALVGPLPWPRYLVLSDGLLSLFRHDVRSLRGVIAHEVGHARGGHPAWLVLCVVVLPLLWLEPLARVLPGEGTPWWTWGVVLVAGGALLVALRALMYRFEHEADQLASEVLGDARVCVEALRRVGELFPSRDTERGSLRHPSEDARIALLLEHERDPASRETFWRRGRVARAVLTGCLLVSIGVAAHAHAQSWGLDRARVAFAEGRFGAAARMLDRVADAGLGERRQHALRELREELAAAFEILPEGGPWLEIRGRLAAGGIERGMAILGRAHDLAAARAARPYLALALALPAPSARIRTLYEYCVAMLERRTADAESLWLHALRA